MNEKMNKCKACGGEVAKSAKSCPHCGAKVKKFPTVLIVILALIVVIAIASASGNDEPKLVDGTTPTQSQTADTEGLDEKTTFKVGETAELKDVQVKFVGVTETSGSTYNKPKDDHIYVLCEFEIVNNSDEELAISSMLSFKGYCDDYTCEYSLGALMEKGDKNQLDGSVAAGKKMKGVIGYEIPKDWKELEIQFTPDFLSGRDIIFVATNK